MDKMRLLNNSFLRLVVLFFIVFFSNLGTHATDNSFFLLAYPGYENYFPYLYLKMVRPDTNGVPYKVGNREPYDLKAITEYGLANYDRFIKFNKEFNRLGLAACADLLISTQNEAGFFITINSRQIPKNAISLHALGISLLTRAYVVTKNIKYLEAALKAATAVYRPLGKSGFRENYGGFLLLREQYQLISLNALMQATVAFAELALVSDMPLMRTQAKVLGLGTASVFQVALQRHLGKTPPASLVQIPELIDGVSIKQLLKLLVNVSPDSTWNNLFLQVDQMYPDMVVLPDAESLAINSPANWLSESICSKQKESTEDVVNRLLGKSVAQFSEIPISAASYQQSLEKTSKYEVFFESYPSRLSGAQSGAIVIRPLNVVQSEKPVVFALPSSLVDSPTSPFKSGGYGVALALQGFTVIVPILTDDINVYGDSNGVGSDFRTFDYDRLGQWIRTKQGQGGAFSLLAPTVQSLFDQFAPKHKLIIVADNEMAVFATLLAKIDNRVNQIFLRNPKSISFLRQRNFKSDFPQFWQIACQVSNKQLINSVSPDQGVEVIQGFRNEFISDLIFEHFDFEQPEIVTIATSTVYSDISEGIKSCCASLENIKDFRNLISKENLIYNFNSILKYVSSLKFEEYTSLDVESGRKTILSKLAPHLPSITNIRVLAKEKIVTKLSVGNYNIDWYTLTSRDSNVVIRGLLVTPLSGKIHGIVLSFDANYDPQYPLGSYGRENDSYFNAYAHKLALAGYIVFLPYIGFDTASKLSALAPMSGTSSWDFLELTYFSAVDFLRQYVSATLLITNYGLSRAGLDATFHAALDTRVSGLVYMNPVSDAKVVASSDIMYASPIAQTIILPFLHYTQQKLIVPRLFVWENGKRDVNDYVSSERSVVDEIRKSYLANGYPEKFKFIQHEFGHQTRLSCAQIFGDECN